MKGRSRKKRSRRRSLRIQKQTRRANDFEDKPFEDNKDFKNKKSFYETLPLKKKILKELNGNQLLEKVQAPKNNFERRIENFSTAVKVNLDPNILWPHKQLIAEYLGDIKFELFKIEDSR